MKLSAAQREHFAQTGHVLVRSLLSAERAAELARRVDAWLAAPEQSGGVWRYSDEEAQARGEHVLSRLERLAPHDPYFASLLHGDLAELVAELLGAAVVLFKDKVNLKLPGSGAFAAHQDAQAGWTRYAALHVTAALSLDQSTRENGCLELLERARITQLLGQEWQPLAERELGDACFVTCPMAPGDVLLFDSYAVHRSQRNLTNAPRRLLYATYNERAYGDHYARYFADKHASYPPDVDRRPDGVYRYRV